MGWDYALVHLKYTIPPSVALTALYWPLLSKADVYKICFLVTIAVVSTIPWDSYLIRQRIWTYPEDAVLGPTLQEIPVEELFFFVIQTYGVSLLHLCLSKATFHPTYLRAKPAWSVRVAGVAGQIALAAAIVEGVLLIRHGGVGTYMGLILVWACPFMLLLWSLSSTFVLALPWSNTLLPILLPTFYLWIVDTFALRRGTWAIESGTKLGIHVVEGLEIEEALFFLVTNVMVVFGLIAFDNTMAILYTFVDVYPNISERPTPWQAIKALLTPASSYDNLRIQGLQQAIDRLGRKSRSFYLASSAFSGRLRIDLVLLYSFCRVADDLVDNAKSVQEAQQWIVHLRSFVKQAYDSNRDGKSKQPLKTLVRSTFPREAQMALLQLPVSKLSQQPLLDLLQGFDEDLKFSAASVGRTSDLWPIQSDRDLEQYGLYVAGTVAELCIDLVMFHYGTAIQSTEQAWFKSAGRQMGKALQIVNIARDIEVDAKLDRVYIPTQWLLEASLKPGDVLKDPRQPAVASLRQRLLQKAFALYDEAKGAIEQLPVEARAPMRVAIESYMEIGRVLQEGAAPSRGGRASVPIARRLWVAWSALNR